MPGIVMAFQIPHISTFLGLPPCLEKWSKISFAVCLTHYITRKRVYSTMKLFKAILWMLFYYAVEHELHFSFHVFWWISLSVRLVETLLSLIFPDLTSSSSQRPIMLPWASIFFLLVEEWKQRRKYDGSLNSFIKRDPCNCFEQWLAASCSVVCSSSSHLRRQLCVSVIFLSDIRIAYDSFPSQPFSYLSCWTPFCGPFSLVVCLS